MPETSQKLSPTLPSRIQAIEGLFPALSFERRSPDMKVTWTSDETPPDEPLDEQPAF
jgi:hypothetical protein